MLFPSTVINAALMSRSSQGVTGPAGDIPIDAPELWFRAEDLELNDGEAVASWSSVGTTSGIQATQATSGNQPTLEENVVNGRSVVRFASGDFLTLNDDLDEMFSGNPETTLIVVLNPTVQAAASSFFAKAGTGGNQFFHDITSTGRPQFGYHDESGWHYARVEQAVGSAFHVLSLFFNAEAISAGKEVGRVDGVEVADTVVAASGDGNGVPNTSAPINIGIRDGGFNPFVGDIAELFVYNRLLGYPAEVAELEAYLLDKYAIS